jgi:UDP-N-acetylmuramate--alanine ligase
MFRGKVQRIHFVGIGGSGMSGIAEVLITQGYTVTGSDMREGEAVKRLRSLGGIIHLGHDPNHVVGAHVVVKSTAVPMTNPEIVAAESAQIPVIPRAEMLAELMRMKYGLAVAGTHGKTTTTSMLATVMHHAKLDPTIVIGGRLDSMGSSARLGAGEFLVAEADESDGSFMLLDPTVAVVTNIDPEHLEHWGSMDALVNGFCDFANKVPFFGFSTLCLDHPVVQSLMPRIRRRVVTYGFNAQADVRGENVQFAGIAASVDVRWRDNPMGTLRLNMPGRHNVSNALAAVAVGLELDIPFDTIAAGLDGFSGVDRRFSVRATIDIGGEEPVTIIDDYGHHPTEIQATLQAAANAWTGRRVIAVFQPHRYTRVRDLFDDFVRCFNHATEVIVCPVYRAGEQPIEDLDHHKLGQGMIEHGHRGVTIVESLEEATSALTEGRESGDVVITLGAGDVNRVCSELEVALNGRR